jgi:hypothetical protein
MTILQQQQRLVGQVLHLDALPRGQLVAGRQRHGERLLVEFVRFQAVHLDRECQDSDIDFSRMQFLQHGIGLILVQHELEPGQLLAQTRRHGRQ